MLGIKHVTKIYRTEDVEQKALDDVSVSFRRNEFVSILGPSGSGKTTLLNIIGGLDHYTDGDLVINGVSTREFDDSDWDTYRNHRIGFVFQNYNLISHQTILSNVELALTLSGVSANDRKKRAADALKEVGLGSHLNKRPGQLSGGQMQRVAIARALVNNPDIILADEPTGALDSKTSVQIMDILKKVAKDKLVVMVTHNPDLAKEYSTRIINVKDGKIEKDSKPFDGKEEKDADDGKKRSSMSLMTALTLSKNNLMTKRGRTILTAIAGSIGIIGIALILALAKGVNNYVAKLGTTGSIVSPITVREKYSESSTLFSVPKARENEVADNSILATDDLTESRFATSKQAVRHNNVTDLKKYVEEHKSELDNIVDVVQYDYNLTLQVYDKDANGNVIRVNPAEADTTKEDENSLFSDSTVDVSIGSVIKSSFVEIVNDKPYEILSGEMPKNANELLLIVNGDKEIPLSVMYALNLRDRTELQKFIDEISRGEEKDPEDKQFSYDDIVGKTYRLILKADYYKNVSGMWVDLSGSNDFITNLYNSGRELKIVGVAKVKNKDDTSGFLGYRHELIDQIIADASKKDIVKAQLADKKTNVVTGLPLSDVGVGYTEALASIGMANIDKPALINFYAKNNEKKKDLKEFLDNYNNSVDDSRKVTYTDAMEALANTITNVVNILSYVLIAFVAISLVVSSIMIGIITYISVLERTKEIGILRAIGASKKDVRRVFRAETIIEGLAAGVLGVVVAWIFCFMINGAVSAFGKIDNITDFSIIHALILIAVSVGLTVFAGLSPANRASSKDPVEALRSE